jgi:hypothetical protein
MPREYQDCEATKFYDKRQMKVAKVVSPTQLQNLQSRRYVFYSTPLQAESTPGPSVAERIMPMKIFKNIIRNRTRNITPCNAVPVPTVAPSASYYQ